MQRRNRWRALIGVAVAAGFVVLVIASARNAAVPVGASGPMSGMSMAGGRDARVDVTMRDIDGRSVRLPGAHPGVVAFVKADGSCESCVATTRVAARAVWRTGGRAALTIVIVDSATSRAEVNAFARSAGRPSARYVVDNRNGNLSSMLGVSGLASVVVYDARGRIIGRPEADAGQLALALRRAGARR